MPQAHDYYPQCPEPLIIGLARGGNRAAFAELVRRRQSSIRNLMRRCCNDTTLADDLAQQVFLKVWLSIRTLRKLSAFEAWLKRLAIHTWLQHIRKNDALRQAGEIKESYRASHDSSAVGMDLDSALAMLSPAERLCVVLSYQDGMSHPEIAELTELPLGTVKSHIRRGAERLQEQLSAYADQPKGKSS